jgi:hypothetical protein
MEGHGKDLAINEHSALLIAVGRVMRRYQCSAAPARAGKYDGLLLELLKASGISEARASEMLTEEISLDTGYN